MLNKENRLLYKNVELMRKCLASTFLVACLVPVWCGSHCREFQLFKYKLVAGTGFEPATFGL